MNVATLEKASKVVRWLIGAALLVVVGALIGMGILGGHKTNGTIIPVAASKPAAQLASLTLRGKYISLDYSSKYAMANSQLGDTSALEQYVLTADTNYTKTATIIVSSLPSGGLADDSGYKMRSINPASYQSTTTTVNGQSVHIMSKSDGSERDAYLIHGNLMCSIALTTALPTQDNLTPELTAILQSFHWNS